MSLCSKQFRLFSFYAVPFSGKQKGALRGQHAGDLFDGEGGQRVLVTQ